MSDQPEENDEIQSISQKFKTVTTIEQNLNVQEQTKSQNPITTTYACLNDQKCYQGDEHSIERNLPELNLPEKILFIVDTIREPEWTQFVFNTGAKYSPLQMIKKVIEMFVLAKSGFQRNHEFALMSLNTNSCHWTCDFTTNVKTVLNYLNSITEDVQEKSVDEQDKCKTYDLGQLFQKMHQHIILSDTTGGPPMFITRVILLYSRSNCIPMFHTGRKHFEELMKNAFFFFDALYVHEAPNNDNMCERIYKEINSLDAKGLSYILEVGRICRNIYNDMAKLTAHPLQRALQKDAYYTITSSASNQEIHTNV